MGSAVTKKQKNMKGFWKNYLKDNLYFWVFGVVAIVLLTVSFFMPPVGVITPSALEGVAELFAFASLGAVYKAIDKGKTASVSHAGTTITVGDNQEEADGIE